MSVLVVTRYDWDVWSRCFFQIEHVSTPFGLVFFVPITPHPCFLSVVPITGIESIDVSECW